MPGLLRITRLKSKEKVSKNFALVFEGLVSAISENRKFFIWTYYKVEYFHIWVGEFFWMLGFQRTRWFILLNLLIFLSTGLYVSRGDLLEQWVFSTLT